MGMAGEGGMCFQDGDFFLAILGTTKGTTI